MRRNVFVVGLDDHNLATLRSLPDVESYAFHQLLTQPELQTGTVSVAGLLDKAFRQLDAFDGPIDAVVGYWDFPVSLMVPVLCRRYGLRSADLTAVMRCEHKYWSRLEQRKVVDNVPAFALLDPAALPATLPRELSYPVWVKPVKSASSEGASYAGDEAELQTAVTRARATLDRIGPAWEELLAMVELPPEIAAAGARTCLVEEAVSGHQFTVEGYGRAGRVRTYGVVDSFRYPGSSSFLRYQYPSVLPEPVQEEAAAVTAKVITAVGLEDSTFNIEYFWDSASGRLNLLEINTRHSQSHAMLFTLVDGVPNHACMVALALGREPELPRGEGRYRTAAKWFLRSFADGVVRRVPTPDEVAAVERAVPGTTVRPVVAVGDRLSQADGEDSYSFVLAEIYTGGDDEAELAARYAACVEALTFQVDDVGKDA
jgi:hypothetical protein